MGYTSGSPTTGDSKVSGAAGQSMQVSPSVDGLWTDIDYINLAIDVLKTQDPALIHSLTDFLMVLPTPSQIEGVLQDAVDRLAQIDRNTHQWILDHSGCLMPYVDLQDRSSVSKSDWDYRDPRTTAWFASTRLSI